MVNLVIEKLNDTAKAPTRATTHAACFDVYANTTDRDIKARCTSNKEYKLTAPIEVYPGHKVMIPTGFKMQVPVGYCLLMYPRSGLAWKNGINLINAVGVIDADYTQEVQVLLHNTSGEIFRVTDGDRIAQLSISQVFATDVILVDSLPSVDSSRLGGFGSTGLI